MRKYKDEEFINQRYSSTSKKWTFQVDIKYTDISGNKKRFTQSFSERNYSTTREAYNEALRCRDEFLYKYNHGYVPTSFTVKEIYEMFKKTSGLSFETKRKKDINFAKIPKQLQDTELTKIRAIDIQENMIKAIDDGCSKRTTQDILTIWKQIFNTAIVNELVQFDPTRKVTVPNPRTPLKKRNVNTDIETVNRVITLIKNSRGDEYSKFRDELIIYAIKICWYLGLRPGECLALDKASVDFDNHVVHITKSTGYSSRNVTELRSTKTETSYRTLPMCNEVENIFKEFFEFQPNDYLFTDSYGLILNSSIVADKIKRMCKKENIEFTMYCLRHQFSTDLITSGEDVRTVMELMGHNNVSTTVDYARSNDGIKRSAISKKSSIIPQNSTNLNCEKK